MVNLISGWLVWLAGWLAGSHSVNLFRRMVGKCDEKTNKYFLLLPFIAFNSTHFVNFLQIFLIIRDNHVNVHWFRPISAGAAAVVAVAGFSNGNPCLWARH